MSVTVIEGSKSSNRCVRGLLYGDDSELTSEIVTTTNAGTIECEYGTWAVKDMIGTGLLTLLHDGQWHDHG